MRRATIVVALACLLAGTVLSFAQQAQLQKQAQVPAHPNELQYKPLEYTPPQAAKHRQVMANGVVGYFVEDHELPLVNIAVTIRVGSYLDPAGKQGLASAVGSQMRAGGTAGYKAEEYDEEADFLAAAISSSIGSTSGGASVNFLTKDTDKALELFFEMLRRPAFQQNRLDLYKSQVIQQLERRNDRTDAIEAREWGRLIYGDEHFTNRLPTRDSVSSITREDMAAFHAQHYHPGNFIFAVSGDFKTAELKAKLERAMADWPKPPGAAAAVPKPTQTPVPGVYMVHKADVNQARVSLGHRGILRGNPDEFAVDMMNDILGGSGFTSRIMNRVRSDEGLAYSAGSGFSAGIYYEGQFRAAFQSKSSTAAQATQIVLDEIERIRNEKVSQEELDTVRTSAVETLSQLFSSASAVAGTFAADEFTGREAGYWDKYRDRIRAVTLDDVQRVARKYLHPENLVILAVGNVDDIQKGDPDKPEYSFQKISKGKVTRIPLPDPATMAYPKP